MAKISLVISIVVTLLTAGLGLMTRTKVTELQSTLKMTKDTLTRTTTDLTKTKGDLKKTQDDLTASQKDVEEKKGEITKLNSDLTTANSEKQKAIDNAKDLEGKIASLNQQIDAMKSGGKPGETPEQTQITINQLTQERDQLKTQLAEAQQVQATLTQKAQQAEENVTRVTAQLHHYEQNIAKAGLTGRVVAVNPGWNFVVIDVGDKQGAAVNAPLIVTRNGQNIAKLRVTSVEPNNSIADIVNGSLPKGQTVQPGDMVVFAGRQPQTAAPQQSAQANSAQGGAPQAQ